MVDVMHYFMEEDMRYSSAEQAEAVSGYRTQLYLLYGKPYKYGIAGNKKSGRNYIPKNASPDEGFDDPLFNQGETKPYIPPTEFNPNSALPFGMNLDAPLG